MFPLFGGIPGGVELLVLFVIFLFMLVVPVAVGVGLFLLGRRSADRGDGEVERLRDRVTELEARLANREAATDDESTADADDAGRER